MTRLSLVLCLLMGLALPATAQESSPLSCGDEAYARRADGRNGLWAVDQPISEAISCYEEALAADPDSQEARVGLLKALVFLGEYTQREREAKLAVFERGQVLAEEGITRLLAGTRLNRRGRKDFSKLIDHLRDRPNACGIYLWGAAHWGFWGRDRGKVAAAMQGVAGRVRDYATIAATLHPGYEHAGGLRILGRLHHEAPRLPLVTWWIDRRKAVAHLEEARGYSPVDALTWLYYVEALLELEPARREAAMKLLRELVEKEADPTVLVEELRAIADARALLERWSR